MLAASKLLADRVRLLHRAAALMALLGLLGTLILWQVTWKRSAHDADASFTDAFRHVTQLVDERMLRNLDLLAGFRGLFSVGSNVSRMQFHEHAAGLRLSERFPGMMSVQYAPLVPHGEQLSFESSARADRSLDPNGYPDFAITPAGDRNFYTPVLYMEPMAGNESGFGYDASAEPARLRTIERARDTGVATAGPPVRTQDGTVIVVRLALYRGNAPAWTEVQRRQGFEGLVNGVIKGPDMFVGVLPDARNGYRLRIEDRGIEGKPPAEPILILDTDEGNAPAPRASGHRLERTILVAGRQWAVALTRPSQNFAFSALPLAVLLAGLCITFTLCWLLRAIATHHEQTASMNRRLAHAAQHDPLTGLPNRTLLEVRVHEAITDAMASGRSLAVIFIDLDRFKPINDTLGHDAGDAILRQVARRLCGAVRPTDTVSRLGGDEFIVLLSDLPAPDLWQLAAARIQRNLAQPMSHGAHIVTVGASLGVALFPQHGTDASALLRHADAAMYGVKRGRAARDHDSAA
ncbi:diguanylate cyclase domain-containing protein [Pseudoroseomonas globiformis]|uniref:Diguanylate cyclase domain-containing protein n=1 Tax=Teichococcus globiformis TaxID=2307229 RepID=A0ABV7FZM1_9PROT